MKRLSSRACWLFKRNRIVMVGFLVITSDAMLSTIMTTAGVHAFGSSFNIKKSVSGASESVRSDLFRDGTIVKTDGHYVTSSSLYLTRYRPAAEEDFLSPFKRNKRFLPKSQTLKASVLKVLSTRKMSSNKNEENNDIETKEGIGNPLQVFTNQMKLKWNTTTDIFLKSLPEPMIKIVTPILALLKILWNGWTKARWYLLTFSAGAVLSIAALIVPISESVSQLSQPVTLFETILHDLDIAYVEKVDLNKLFETGVAAMLDSLDPYTEFESQTAATALSESIDGRYGGVGLVIAGIPEQKLRGTQEEIIPRSQISNADLDVSNQEKKPSISETQIENLSDDGDTGSVDFSKISSDDVDEDDGLQSGKSPRYQGIRVVSAFEGYAFDYGLRVGDRLLQVDDLPITSKVSIEQVRNKLRGQPGTSVEIAFERDGVDGIQNIRIPRSVVRLRDVKLATLVGNPYDGVGYIQLSGFASDAGREVRNAIRYLQQAAEDASGGERTLQGLILDLRGNPGGLLTSAVDVASLLVPKGSDIVSAKGRGFPGVTYRSRVDPILDISKTKLAVLVNGNTASAAEIVSGAVQDLDVGVIVGADRTFGKGLVQNVEELPFNTALKFTVAKYYTPSGRCIQGVKYTEGSIYGEDGGSKDGRYIANKISEKDRNTYYTRLGRVVKDGGGIEADYKVSSPKASALEVTLLRSGIIGDFAAEWSKKHELTNNFQVDEDTYKQFQIFVAEKQRKGEIQLEELYSRPLKDLKKALAQSGYKGSENSVEQLKARILMDMKHDFDKYRADIKEDISNSILARYLPESMLIERSIRSDVQVGEAVKLIKSRNKFDTLLAKGTAYERQQQQQIVSLGNIEGNMISSSNPVRRNSYSGNADPWKERDSKVEGFRTIIEW